MTPPWVTTKMVFSGAEAIRAAMRLTREKKAPIRSPLPKANCLSNLSQRWTPSGSMDSTCLKVSFSQVPKSISRNSRMVSIGSPEVPRTALAVSIQRSIGLQKQRSGRWRGIKLSIALAWAWPIALRQRSVRPMKWRPGVSSVSPCRIRSRRFLLLEDMSGRRGKGRLTKQTMALWKGARRSGQKRSMDEMSA